MEKKQIKAKYIVVKQPDDNVVYRNNIRFIYIKPYFKLRHNGK